ncbi:MAG TPA: hypothetical protein ENF18_02700 [candidate division WOR-3 bacterium]|uniref:Mannosylglycerate hydrolase MGH1-like glycoside hydrolase domain-containing protein n=1 Tax=candidate division WOR-3 bacterium TaxID=2052148 RepID=A0A7C0VBH8_UNCW3|nr:hypothetical protein [candidate division WOR-3 bacterium]
MSRKNLEFKCFYNEKIRIFSEELLESNRKQGFSRNLKMFYGYTSPDSVHFHQWFWYSCFHAIVLSQFDPSFAIRELNTLFSVQEEDGFVPHIILWKWRIVDLLKPWWYREVKSKSLFYTAEIQPPVAGMSLGYIYNRLRNKEVLESLVDSVYRFYIYLSKHRDPDNDGLISIITPLESGMDMLPIYDNVLGNPDHDLMYQKRLIRQMLTFYKSIDWNLERVFEAQVFDVEDVAFNTIYVLGLKELSRVLRRYDRARSEEISSLARRVERAIINKMWDSDDGIFYSLMSRGNKEVMLRIKTVSSLFPLLLDIPEYMVSSLVSYIKSKRHFWSEWPIPSVSMDERSFGPLTETRFLWRGTTWINTNWFIWQGLRKSGEIHLANELVKRTWGLIEKYGFCEFYDPFKGFPGGAMRDFGWSTLGSLMFVEELSNL